MKLREIAQIFKKKRIELGYTQLDLATKLGYSSAQYISNFERGLSGLPLNKIDIIADLFGVSKPKLAKIVMAEQRKHLYKIWGLNKPGIKLDKA